MASLVENVSMLLALVQPVPSEWIGVAQAKTGERHAGDSMSCLPCSGYGDMVNAWRKALRWTPGLDHALSVMLAAVASTKSVGDQLWIKVIGPASCGKSTLCEALSVNTTYIVAKSTIRGFHSGYRMDDGNEGQDHSLIPLIRGRTLVTKDGDTLLQSPNLSQILSEARDLYDSTSRTHYRNAIAKDYQGIRMTWLLCGTSSLRAIDSSELGERFLDCVIMEGIDNELEDEVLWRVANRAERNVSIESDGKPETQYEPELALAMQLTGGYVDYLRVNAADGLSAINMPDWARRKCAYLGKFTAFMRARPSKRQEETAEREFAARLVSQMVRLAKCLALVLNRTEVDEEVMDRVRRVAMDTSRGQTMHLVRRVAHSLSGMEMRGLALVANLPDEKVRPLLRFLHQIGVMELVQMRDGKSTSRRWRLTDRMRRLYNLVVENTDA